MDPLAGIADQHRFTEHLFGKFRTHRPATFRLDAVERHVDSKVESTCGEVVKQTCAHAHVGNVYPLSGVDKYRTRNARMPPLVLVLDVAGVGPLDYAQGKRVC